MLYGAKVMAATAMKLVDDPKLVDEAKEEFKKFLEEIEEL